MEGRPRTVPVLPRPRPFLDLYSYAIRHPDLLDRAAFLLRAQALEALQGYEVRHQGALRQRRFTRDRAKLRNDLGSLRPHVGNGLHEELAALRNGLSHGESYPDDELQSWLRPIDLLCRATLMRLLDFKDEDIASAMRGR